MHEKLALEKHSNSEPHDESHGAALRSWPAPLPQVSMPWSPTRDASSRDLPRLLSQGSLRLRSTLQSQKSLSSLEGASLLRTSSMKV